ncbi:MAG: hypothetical protein HKM07_05730 [Chlamydiae bacterium]|nr:hypothetical protein [Chlamydiota bacterium]
MSWTFIIIIAVLVFIAYQLLQLNRGKKYELALKVAEKSEEKVREFFPHLYPTADEGMKEEIRDFVAQSIKENMEDHDSTSTDRDDLTYYIYLGRYKIINDKIKAETDLKKKEKMQSVKEDISKELKNWEDRLDSMVDKRKISEWEKSFVLWHFLKGINDQFPERYFELEDYFGSKFRDLQPIKG